MADTFVDYNRICEMIYKTAERSIMNTPYLETERLCLRPIDPRDVQSVFDCWMRDEEVSRYMYWKASDKIEDAQEFIDYERNMYESDTWYRWIIVLKETKQIIGTCLIYYNEEELNWDISYNLGRKYWGKGYATEAMKRVMNYAESVLQLEEFIAIHAVENKSSQRIIEKLGFVYEKEVPYECNGGTIITKGKFYRKKKFPKS